MIQGPDSFIVDVGLSKTFAIAQRWEMTATNFLDTTNYNNPEANVTSPGSVGVLTGACGEQDLDSAGPRALRMGLRLEW